MSARTVRRAVVVAVSLVVAAVALALPVAAEHTSGVARRLADVGFYVEPGSGADAAALEQVVADARRNGERLMVAALGDTPSGGATTFADAVLDDVGEGTVVVTTPSEVGYSSTYHSTAALDRAGEASIDDFRVSPERGAAAFAAALVGGSVAPSSRTAPTGGRGGGGGLLLVLLAGGALVFGVMSWQRRRAVARHTAAALEEAERELRAQLSSLADAILELSDPVTVSGDKEANAHFARATATYSAAMDELDRADRLAQLEPLADRVDRANWEIAATQALLDGRAVPPEPEEHPSCFFDPTHGAGVEEAVVETPAGSKAIGVCRRCASVLRHGETPEPREITVGGHPVPAGAAPRAFGGQGLGGVLGALAGATILFGGMRRPIGWDRYAVGGRRSPFGAGSRGFGLTSLPGGGRARGRGGFGLGGGGLGRGRGGRRLR